MLRPHPQKAFFPLSTSSSQQFHHIFLEYLFCADRSQTQWFWAPLTRAAFTVLRLLGESVFAPPDATSKMDCKCLQGGDCLATYKAPGTQASHSFLYIPGTWHTVGSHCVSRVSKTVRPVFPCQDQQGIGIEQPPGATHI